MTDDDWKPTCVLCLQRKPPVETPLESGHCCDGCSTRLHSTIADIGFLAVQAAAWIAPRSGSRSGAVAYGSRPPINVEACDPELALVLLEPGDPSSAVTVLECVEMWERAIREDRNMSPYGPASASRAITHGRPMSSTTATLTGCVSFLLGQVEWATTAPGFGLEDFAAHMRRCASVLRRWDESTVTVGTRIACPAMVEDEACGTPLRISTGAEPVTCRGCGHSWTAEWLIRVAGADVDGWADMEAVVRLSGLAESTIRRWARSGKVRRRGMLYSVRDIADTTTRAVGT